MKRGPQPHSIVKMLKEKDRENFVSNKRKA